MKTLPEKRPAERVTVRFRFGRELGTGVSLSPGATVTATVRKGVDPAPAALVPEAAVISGTDVLVRVVGGLDGVQYLLTCLAPTSDGNLLQLDGILPVATPR